jgi:hypothetical protein
MKSFLKTHGHFVMVRYLRERAQKQVSGEVRAHEGRVGLEGFGGIRPL